MVKVIKSFCCGYYCLCMGFFIYLVLYRMEKKMLWYKASCMRLCSCVFILGRNHISLEHFDIRSYFNDKLDFRSWLWTWSWPEARSTYSLLLAKVWRREMPGMAANAINAAGGVSANQYFNFCCMFHLQVMIISPGAFIILVWGIAFVLQAPLGWRSWICPGGNGFALSPTQSRAAGRAPGALLWFRPADTVTSVQVSGVGQGLTHIACSCNFSPEVMPSCTSDFFSLGCSGLFIKSFGSYMWKML